MNANIIKELQVTPTGFRNPITNERPMACSQFKEDKPDVADYHHLADEYILSVKICTSFIANNAQYSRARELAERNLQNHLYGEIIFKLDEILSACTDYDSRLAIEIASELRDKLRGE